MIYTMRSAAEVGSIIRSYLSPENTEKLRQRLDISDEDFNLALNGEKLFSYKHIQIICTFLNIDLKTLLFEE